MRVFIFLSICAIALSASVKDVADEKDREAVDALKELPQDELHEALKHDEFFNDPTFSDEDKEFVDGLDQNDLRDLIEEFSTKKNDEEKKEKTVEKDIETEEKGLEIEEKDVEEKGLQPEEEKDVEGEEETEGEEESEDEEYDEEEDEISDPRRRRRRRKRLGRLWRKIRDFLRKHGQKVRNGIRAIRRGIWRCCKVTKRCKGKWFCFLGKP